LSAGNIESRNCFGCAKGCADEAVGSNRGAFRRIGGNKSPASGAASLPNLKLAGPPSSQATTANEITAQ